MRGLRNQYVCDRLRLPVWLSGESERSRYALLAAVVATAGLSAALAVPAAAQQAPADGQDGSASRSVAGSGAPVLAGEFVFGGRWLAAGVVSLDWDDVTGAAGYELMVRAADGWVLLDGRGSAGGMLVEFDGPSALVAGLARDVGEHWFAVRARNVFGVSEWSPSTAVAVPEDAVGGGSGGGVFDPFTAPTRSGIDLEALREAVATVTPGQADCAAAAALDVAGVAVVDAPAGLNDPDEPLTVAEVTRIAGGCVLVDYVALAGRSVSEVRAVLASESSVHAVSEPLRGFAPTHDESGNDDDAFHHDDGGGPQWHLTPEFTKVPGGLWDGWDPGAGREVVVAVLDSGVDVSHEDLDGQIASGSLGGCHEEDLSGHGTHVAGVVAAEHDPAATATNVHVAGVAPQAKILPVRVELRDEPACAGGGSPLTIPEAVAAAVNAGADVINMSFAGRPPDDEAGLEVGGIAIAEAGAFESVLRAASMLGVVLVASAGNCGNDNDVTSGGVTMKGWEHNNCSEHNETQSPALYDDVISVAAVDHGGGRSSFSTAQAHVDVAAPGGSILSTVPLLTCTAEDIDGDGTYDRWTPLGCGRDAPAVECPSSLALPTSVFKMPVYCSFPVIHKSGTSMAAPFVSGVVAHMLNRHPHATPGQVQRALEATASHPRGVGRDDEYGHGIVDPDGAVVGLGAILDRRVPSGPLGGFVAVSSGDAHSCGLRSNGAVQCWGAAVVADGVPGFAFESVASPPAADFVCGVRRGDQAVVCWGDVPAGVATVAGSGAVGAPEGRFVQVAVGESHVCGVRPDGRVVCWGDNSSDQTDVPLSRFSGSGGEPVSKVVAGSDHTCAITDASDVVCWGDDSEGQLPPSSLPFAVRDVAAGASHTCVVSTRLAVSCYGDNTDGQLDGPAGDFANVWAGADHTCARALPGWALSCWGDSGDGRLAAPAAPLIEVSAGEGHACGLLGDATVSCWGNNASRQAPQGRLTSLSFTAGGMDLLDGVFDADVTEYEVAAFAGTATVGWTAHGASAGDADPQVKVSVVSADGSSSVTGSAAADHAVFVQDGSVVTVNVMGPFDGIVTRSYAIRVVARPQLAALSVRRLASGVDCPGAGCPTYVLVPGFDAAVTEYSVVVPPDVDEVTVAYSAADVADSVSVLPLDASGGADGSPGHQVALTTNTGFVSVDAGNRHSCGLTAGGVARCWGGYDFSGEARVPSGTYLLVSAGWAHTCAIETDNSVACWGDNYWGQSRAPSGSFASVWAGGGHSCALTTSGTVRCWGYDYSGQSSPPSGTFTAVAAGSNHSCGITAAGTLRCWGLNIRGEASPPSGTFTALSTSWRHTCAIATDSTVSCWGASGSGRTTAPSGTFISVSAGDEHSCGVKTDNTAVCWGNNGSGRATAPAGSFTAVSAGDEHSCGLTTAGAVLCWGAAIAAAQPAEPAAVTVSVTSGTDATVTTSYTVTIKRTDTQQASSASGAASTGYASDRSLIDETLAGSPATGRSANTAQCTSPATTPVPPQSPITVSDPALRAALEQALNKPAGETITAAEMATLTTLSVPRTAAAPGAVTDLTGLQHATALEALDVAGHDIASLAPLTCLTSLKALNVARNQITDLAALRGLTSLQRLYLYDNQITDITALSGLTNLTSLYLDHNRIADVSALSKLTALRTLGFGDNDITSVSALSTLTGLGTLYVFDNDITDAASLSGLSGLGTLWVDGNDLTNPYQLTALTALGYLDARHNLISDIAPLDTGGATVHSEPQRTTTVRITDAGLRALLLAVLNKGPRQPINPDEIATIARLERLGRQGDPAPVGDLTGLEHGTALRELRLRRNTFTGIEPIAQLEGLTHLDLQSNQLTGLGSLRGLKSLQWLNLIDNNLTRIEGPPPLIHTLFADSNQITDITALAALNRLAVLSLKANNIEDLTPLAQLSELHWIILTDNNIADLEPLKNLTRIYYLRLNHNNITDLEPLKNLTRLTNLHLQGNNIADLEPLKSLTRLRVLDLRDNNITSLEPLRGLTSLQDLFIDGNHITDFTPLNGIPGLTIHGRNNQTTPG